MAQLLEIKDLLIRIYGRFESYFLIAVKFLVAFVMFFSINSSIGYMERISTVPVALILALVSSILPVGAMLLLASLVVLLDMYTLAIEALVVTLLVLLVLYFVYFRFAPKDGLEVILTPVCFHFNIPYVVPMVGGLLRPVYSFISMVCGTVLYFFLDGIRQNANVLAAGAAGEEGDFSKLNVVIGQLISKEMFVTIAIFTMTSLIVYFTSRLAVEHAWTVAIIAGVIFDLVGMQVGYMMIGISGRGAHLILGHAAALAVCFVVQFFFMNLDYARTERVQFQDDEYYYYVTAVPKKTIATPHKKVQHFNSSGSKPAKPVSEEESRKNLAQELDIDEELLK